MSLDYTNGIFEDSDCIINDVGKEDICSLNPSPVKALNQHKGMILGLKNDNGNIDLGECSSKKTMKVDSKVLVIGGAGLQDHKTSDDMDDICVDDFDIDDLSQNDIPDYCEKPAALCVSESSNTPQQSFCEEGFSNSWNKNRNAASSAVVKPTKPCQ